MKCPNCNQDLPVDHITMLLADNIEAEPNKTQRLFGFKLIVDPSLPPDTMQFVIDGKVDTFLYIPTDERTSDTG